MKKSNQTIISTDRLELIAATAAHLQMELKSPQGLASLLNAQIDTGWPPGEYDRGAQEFFLKCLEEGGQEVIGWYSWYAIRRKTADKSAVIIGAGGYFGPPNEEGEVEIGFSVMPERQNLGYGTEIAEGLIKHAFTHKTVKKVIAHTSPENTVSCKVMKKAGFLASGIDETGNNRFEISR